MQRFLVHHNPQTVEEMPQGVCLLSHNYRVPSQLKLP